MNGTDILLLVDTGAAYEAVGSQRDMTISRKRSWIDLSAKGDDEEVGDVGRRSYPLTCDAVYVPDDGAYLALLTAFDAGDTILVRQSENGVEVEGGTAHILDMSKKAPDQAAAVLSIELRIPGGWDEGGRW